MSGGFRLRYKLERRRDRIAEDLALCNLVHTFDGGILVFDRSWFVSCFGNSGEMVLKSTSSVKVKS